MRQVGHAGDGLVADVRQRLALQHEVAALVLPAGSGQAKGRRGQARLEYLGCSGTGLPPAQRQRRQAVQAGQAVPVPLSRAKPVAQLPTQPQPHVSASSSVQPSTHSITMAGGSWQTPLTCSVERCPRSASSACSSRAASACASGGVMPPTLKSLATCSSTPSLTALQAGGGEKLGEERL